MFAEQEVDGFLHPKRIRMLAAELYTVFQLNFSRETGCAFDRVLADSNLETGAVFGDAEIDIGNFLSAIFVAYEANPLPASNVASMEPVLSEVEGRSGMWEVCGPVLRWLVLFLFL